MRNVPVPANSAERLTELLKAGNKVRGFKKVVLKPDGSLSHYARQMIEVEAGDVMELVKAYKGPDDDIVKALGQGSGRLSPETRVILQADDLFHLIEKAKPVKAEAPAATTIPLDLPPLSEV